MNYLEIEDLIKKVCKENNVDCKVRIRWSSRLACYNYNENTIYFNPDRVTNMAKKMNMSMNEFITFTTYHEIGHYLDYLKGDISDSIIEREVAAWELSRELVPEYKLIQYDEFNKINLNSYKKKYKFVQSN